MEFPNIDPVIISFGPLAISWYSLSYVVGILLGWHLAVKLAEKYNSPFSKKNIDDFITWLIIGVIIGGRLGHVFFYEPSKFLANPIDIFKTYEGGMSFHGGLAGYVTAAIIFCRIYKKPFLALTDLSAMVVPIALFLGRIANYINGELYGKITDVPWAVVFPYSDGFPRHPTQLYEAALEGAAIFLILMVTNNRFRLLEKVGLLSSMFMILYGTFRFFVEFLKEPTHQAGYLFDHFTMGQVLCVLMIIIGLYPIYRYRKSSSGGVSNAN